MLGRLIDHVYIISSDQLDLFFSLVVSFSCFSWPLCFNALAANIRYPRPWSRLVYSLDPRRLGATQAEWVWEWVREWVCVCVTHLYGCKTSITFKYTYIYIYIYIYMRGDHWGPGGVGDQRRHLPGTRANVPAGLWWRTWAHIRRSWWSP